MADMHHGSAVVAVLTAAGSGTRLGAQVPKALVLLAGESLLRRAARGLLDSGVVDHVVVTAPADQVKVFTAELAGLGGTSRATVEVVAGAATSRQASVARGLEAALRACPQAQVVLVHDAARALTPPAVTQRVVAAVQAGYDAVVPALPVTDTVKEVRAAEEASPSPAQTGADRAARQRHADDGVEQVAATPDRTRLRAVQTPQGFATETLLAAHRLGADRAGDEAIAASDDAGLVEAAGGSVVVVPGDPMSLKVTTPLDLALAQLLLER
ncbi:IspD/TarI family cytidylyltransferase [Actinomyces faecalis]|uniref:IspD/TarI family cytidylyltransferase n=1 Tax=Actinomyces faecalis TaxID=2722820 RepID=UPI0015539A43|nr:IspD/TarI family cytidylyltransferase [Actinomyces faecalis]